MKVNLNLNQPKIRTGVNFEGYKPTKSEYGDREYDFNYVYDDSKYDCYVEFFSVAKDENNNYKITGLLDNVDNLYATHDREKGVKLESGRATRINLAADYNIAPDEAFAYHYKLYPKNNPMGTPIYQIDPGNAINDAQSSGKAYEIYNIVSDKASTVSQGGSMKLIIPDNYNVIWKYDENNKIVKKSPEEIQDLKSSSKNFANKIGGSLAGIEKDLDNGELDNYTRIVTTPLFTDDSVSAHAYWNKNCFQMANSLGNINNYASLQRKMFAKGINLVSDGAYVNEGLEGIHFRHILKWGDKSPYFNWFNISGLKDSPLNLGVFGKKLNHVTHRLVNSPYKFIQNDDGSISVKSAKYDKTKPTYIQIYDDRLVNADKLSDKELIKAYDKFDKNYLDINNHNDTVVPYSFQINPKTYLENVKHLNDYNKSAPADKKVKLNSGEGTRAVAKFEYFGLDGKHESGFYTWDANPDIAKLIFVPSHADTQDLINITDPDLRAKKIKLLQQKNMEVQDYAVSSAKYWTKKTNQILNLDVAQNLKNIDDKSPEEITSLIKSLSNGKVFPKKLHINQNIIENVLNSDYNLKGLQNNETYKEAILHNIMDTPLDSIEVGDEIASVLSSPYMSKRATSEDEIGLTRFEMFKKGNPHVTPEYKEAYDKADKMYTQELANFANEIFANINSQLPERNKLHDKDGNLTDFGKYVIPQLAPEIVRFAVIKSVAPNTIVSTDPKTGEISYNYNELKKTSLTSMGIIADCPEDEAESVINKIRSRVKKIQPSDKQKLTNALFQSIKGTNADSFKLAEMIVDRTEAGLDWRIDATKDIADIESVRNRKTDFEFTWNQVIKFWSKFTDGIKEYHPDAYIAAEVTDEAEIYGKGNGGKSGARYGNSTEAVKKLLNETGFTTTANYTYFSSNLTGIFGKLFADENGVERGTRHNGTILEQLVGNANFLQSGSLESLLYSYTFAGNHDKCRALEGFAEDMDMVYTDLTNVENFEKRQRAYKILHGMGYGDNPSKEAVDCFNFARTSNLAIAKAESIASGMGKAKELIGLDQNKKDLVYGSMLEALKNLTNGHHKGKTFEADGFGTKDFSVALDVVLDEMEYVNQDTHFELTPDERKALKNETFKQIIDPAMSRLLGQMKFLIALTGNPTLFAGDDMGSTGYETTTKNIYLQNRNVIHEEWVDPQSPDFKPYIKQFKDFLDDQFKLRTRPELQPLNDGTPFALKEQPAYTDDGNATSVSALLRQSPNGAITVSIFNTEGLNHKYDEYYDSKQITLNNIDLNDDRGGKVGLRGGLRAGMKFKNANKADNSIYTVNEHNQIVGPNGSPITFKDTTLILYSIDNYQPSFTGRKTLYNPQYNFVSKPYAQINKEEHNIGKKLAITSK